MSYLPFNTRWRFTRSRMNEDPHQKQLDCMCGLDVLVAPFGQTSRVPCEDRFHLSLSESSLHISQFSNFISMTFERQHVISNNVAFLQV